MQVYTLEGTIKKRLFEHETVLSFLTRMPEFIVAHKIPDEMVMFSAEFFYHPERMCEIVLLIAGDSTHLGRKEKYENCIFSGHTESIGETVVVNDAKNHPAFLELDPRVNAEIFCECKITADLSLILNMECSSDFISEEAFRWFSEVKERISPSSSPDSIT